MSLSPAVVIGAGLVGASVGCALTKAGHRVHLEDRNASHVQVAAGIGAGTSEPAVPDEVRLVVVAVPPAALAAVIIDALDRFPRATVTDVGSVKAGVLNALWDSGGDVTRYVGSHPMAGSQFSGPLTAQADLFHDRTWVIAPHRKSSAAATQDVRDLVAACGANEVIMDVDIHDSAVARVSHVPHLMSVLMAGHLNEVPVEQLQLAGQGLRDVTRIAGSDPDLWEQILGANSAAVLPELRAVQHQLDTLISAIESDGTAGAQAHAVLAHLERGLAGTRRIPGKHGAAPVQYRQLVVEIPDAPGALSRLFADVAQAGVNVEDISIQHDPDRQVGYLSLAVAPDQADALVGSMTDAGWAIGDSDPSSDSAG
ncbi:prephenate dehydrogenase [Microlunatus endophyticus]|uniref:Prephenate dehydrogenase n=1 Tax=Microlunatus endophyticus TaxID=1716077 RepID=A0A917S391_9ACTN|nr:prephenate dehydrogenase [Microlunatus endophyticus]GGL54524.1 prephenate dehydrogenase [Microlunatus endophyticus]